MRQISFLYIFLFLLFFSGCSTTPKELPVLPAKDWLADDQDKKEVKSEKFDIYSPDKVMTMNDLVWLAIQQSPVISNGRINLDVCEITKRDAQWRYLPEMHLSFHITNNMTKYNTGNRYASSNYGETTYEITFTGYYTNPLTTYLSVKAQDELMQTAIITQRKAIGDIIFRIAQNLLQMNLLEKRIATIEERIAGYKEMHDYVSITNSQNASGYSPSEYVNDGTLSYFEMRLREIQMELTITRTNLKQIVGLNINQALKVDSASILPLINSFNPADLNWQTCWDQSENHYLIRQQVRLEQANIYLAWASYMPGISLYINESPGKGQYQPPDGQADQFLHLILDFPLLDWGHRLRNADISAARQRQRRLDEIQRTREYEEGWLANEQRLQLAKYKIERQEQSIKNDLRRLETMEVSYKNGALPYNSLIDQNEKVVESQLTLAELESAENQLKLAWMHAAALLTKHYLGEAGYQKVSK